MKISFKTFLAAAALAVVGTSALAQASAPAGVNTPGTDQRQANQQKRLDSGVASGALTKRETLRLQREQAVTNKAEEKAKADGTVTAQERNRVHKMEKRSSRDVYRQKHDPQRAASAAGV